MEVEEMKDYKEDIDIKVEPPGYDPNSSLEFEGVNVIRVLKSELKNDVNMKCEPLDCAHETDSVTVIEFHPTLASEKLLNREMKEDEEEEKIDIKYESLDYGLKRPVIENANEHAEKQFECHKCSYKTKSKYKQVLNRHIMSQHAEDMLECHQCSYKSKNKYNLRKHILLYHQKEPPPQHACDICSYRSIYKSVLKRHIMRKHTQFSLECSLCQKSFKQKISLDSHYVSTHRDQNDSFKHLLTNKVSQCSKCSYITGDATRFKNHLLTHEEDQNKFKFECYTCGYKCVKKSNLKIHVRRIHTGQLPFSCTECNKRFMVKQQLDGHIVARDKENEELMKTVTSKLHQCLKCSYKAVRSFDLKNHIKRCNNK